MPWQNECKMEMLQEYIWGTLDKAEEISKALQFIVCHMPPELFAVK